MHFALIRAFSMQQVASEEVDKFPDEVDTCTRFVNLRRVLCKILVGWDSVKVGRGALVHLSFMSDACCN